MCCTLLFGERMIMSKSFKIILLMTLLCSCSIDNYSNASSEITDIDTIEKNSSSTFNDYEEKETNINILTSERESYLIESIINLYNINFSDEEKIKPSIKTLKQSEIGNEFITNPQCYDLVFLPDEYLKTSVNCHLLDPIESNISQVIQNNLINPLKDLVINNILYSYPTYIESGYITFYNNKYINQENINSLENILKIAKDKGKKVQMQFESSWSAPMFLSTTNKKMNNYINYSYENNTIKYECNWDNPENIKIYNYLSKLFSQYIDEGVLESIYSESVVNGFYEDDLLAVVGLPIHYNKLFTEEGLDNVMSYKLPEFSISNESYQIGSFITSKSYVVASSSNNKKTAHHFANFLISGEVQKLRYDMTGSIPASKSLLTSPSFTDKLTDVEKAYIEQSNYAINQSTQIENSFYEIMDDICFALFNDNLLSNKTISELLIESVALLIQ